MYLSKSKFCTAYQCLKQLWLKENKSEEMIELNNEAVFETGHEVGELAKNLFGKHIDIVFNKDLKQMILDTKKVLEKDEIVVTEASFSYENNFCSVDILKKNGNNYEIYEVKSSTGVSDIYKIDASYQLYILLKLGLNVKKIAIVHLNSGYKRYGELELDKLFTISDITDICYNNQEMIQNKIKEIDKYMEKGEEKNKKLGLYCFNPYECPFFNYCSKNLEKPNVFDIAGMSIKQKIDLYNNNLISFNDLVNAKINAKYQEQIDYEINNLEPKIEMDGIKEFLEEVRYPLYYLDFETYQEAIPKYDGISPYMQIPFQYSLHYELEEDGELYHEEFLAEAGIDPRRSLAEKLVKDIPINACTMAYNYTFEKSVIKNLAEMYPDLSNHLMNIYHNMIDLMVPFRKRNYYVKEMQGSYSIKYVLPALFPNDESLNYHNLADVHNGSEAMNTYKLLQTLSREEQQKLRHSLLKYCELDTYAMVKIYKKLKELEKVKCKKM